MPFSTTMAPAASPERQIPRTVSTINLPDDRSNLIQQIQGACERDSVILKIVLIALSQNVDDEQHTHTSKKIKGTKGKLGRWVQKKLSKRRRREQGKEVNNEMHGDTITSTATTATTRSKTRSMGEPDTVHDDLSFFLASEMFLPNSDDTVSFKSATSEPQRKSTKESFESFVVAVTRVIFRVTRTGINAMRFLLNLGIFQTFVVLLLLGTAPAQTILFVTAFFVLRTIIGLAAHIRTEIYQPLQATQGSNRELWEYLKWEFQNCRQGDVAALKRYMWGVAYPYYHHRRQRRRERKREGK